jgi:octaprenyl-diphosphate synthase
LIYALESDGAAGRRMVRTVLEEKGFDSVRPEQITALVHESGALDRTRAAALDFAARAKACLNGNGTSDFGRALRMVPDFILDRDN